MNYKVACYAWNVIFFLQCSFVKLNKLFLIFFLAEEKKEEKKEESEESDEDMGFGLFD